MTGSHLARYVGRYALNGTIATVGLTDDGHLTVALTGQPSGPPLHQVGKNEFVAEEAGVRLFFEGDGPQTNWLRSQYRGAEVCGIRIAEESATDTAEIDALPPDPVGEWYGMLDTPRGKRALLISISRATDGTLKAELSSPGLTDGKLPVTSITLEGDKLRFQAAPLSASYQGSWAPNGQSWIGTFTQGGELPLELLKGLPPAKLVVAGPPSTKTASPVLRASICASCCASRSRRMSE